MHFDSLGLIVSDTSGEPSCYGDSCAETSRWMHLRQLLEDPPPDPTRLLQFSTSIGYVRHPSPSLPADWREGDFSSDQALPLYLAMRRGGLSANASFMQGEINKEYKTGNGCYISPIFWAIIENSGFWLNFFCAAQALIFKIPIRWSDSKKWFEGTADATADYLNWFHASIYCKRWVRRLVNPDLLLEKIKSYYRNEAYTEELLSLYKRAIEKVYR